MSRRSLLPPIRKPRRRSLPRVGSLHAKRLETACQNRMPYFSAFRSFSCFVRCSANRARLMPLLCRPGFSPPEALWQRQPQLATASEPLRPALPFSLFRFPAFATTCRWDCGGDCEAARRCRQVWRAVGADRCVAFAFFPLTDGRTDAHPDQSGTSSCSMMARIGGRVPGVGNCGGHSAPSS
jgi:hypothetical protein